MGTSPEEASEEPARSRVASAWVDCSPAAFYPGLALGVAAAIAILWLLKTI